MAIVVSGNDKALKMHLQVDVDDKGDPVMSTRTLGSVKVNASNDDLYAIANEAGTLLIPTLSEIKVSESYVLESE